MDLRRRTFGPHPTAQDWQAASKADIEQALAADVIRRSPKFYAGYDEDAVKFVRNTMGPTKWDMLLAAEAFGLAPRGTYLDPSERKRRHATMSAEFKAPSKIEVTRRPERETQSSEDHPGMSPPHQSALSIGREREGWKPLYWKRVLAEYKKEAPRRGGLGNTLDLELWVMHAPDAHTPFTRVDWPDPSDVRGAEQFARQVIEDGGAQFAEVNARARRPHSKEAAIYTLANFARA